MTRVNMEYEVEIDGVTRKVELPFVTGVMADLSGNAAEPLAAVADRLFFEIDRDNFDARMAAISPRLAFAVPNTLTGKGDLQVEITFTCMADFSPAAVARQVEPLRTLLEARRQHADGGDEGGAIVETIAEIDRQVSQQLRPILHTGDFQRLEATWRGLHHLVSHSETDETLRIKVLNISKSDLARALAKFKGASWDHGPIFRKVYRDGYGSFGAAPFGCLIGDYAFDHSPADVEMLAEMAKICAAAHVPFLAAASPGVMQLDSWSELPIPRDLSKILATREYEAWHALRESEEARYLGLTLPRFLVRPPYRAETVLGEFAFEEDARDMHSGRFAWANSVYLMAVNIHRSFRLRGWCTRIHGLETGGAVHGLPVVRLADRAGGVMMLCPTEVAIDGRRERELARNGFIALVHRSDSDTAVFLSTPSLGKPAEYADVEAAANARRATQLPYVFANCRIAHYLHAIVRDRFAASTDRQRVQQWLQNWIATYVDSDSATPEPITQSSKPLAAATISVEQAPEDPTALTATFYIRLND